MGLHLPFLEQLKLACLPEPVTEFPFAKAIGRKWRFDFCWINYGHHLAAEREGGTFKEGGGRHNRAKGYRDDLRKYAEAALMGWYVVRFDTSMERSGEALTLVERALLIVTTGSYQPPLPQQRIPRRKRKSKR